MNRVLLLLASLLLWLVTTSIHAQLLVSPVRVVLDENRRSAEVYLLNTTQETRTYQILWVEKYQTEEGGYRELTTAEMDSAAKASELVRFSPRQVTIAPGQRQKVRLRMGRLANVADGEYRSHLLFRAVAINSDGLAESSSGQGMSLKMDVNISVSIPIMVRKGTMSVDTRISAIDLERLPPAGKKGQLMMLLTLSRTGLGSSYGAVEVFMQDPKKKSLSQIGILTNIALFQESAQRKLRIPLKVDSIPSGSLIQVIYKGDDEFAGRSWDKKVFRAN